VVVPLADPVTGKLRLVRLSRREGRERRAANEQRTEEILAELQALGLEPILIDTTNRDEIFTRFLAWVEARQVAVREWF
jgi:hypothetical protein